ncbi:hypothetical protein CRENPOLYSF2_2900009 [Crenothrix polyspora]|uniref:Uncharacterized protein n=1 Tax=Crenothrix polyspora TaxID=360316 RepID=A0A1R4H965_9GAMM|nr:hypothetical protein CRENPOLYSF2_2900009 [Crenothrix polyspora]
MVLAFCRRGLAGVIYICVFDVKSAQRHTKKALPKDSAFFLSYLSIVGVRLTYRQPTIFSP